MSSAVVTAAAAGADSDNELIRQVRSGQRQAFHQLYVRHSTSAYNLAWHLTGNAAEADDLVAEAFARVLSALRGDGGPNSAFRTYLLTTLRNIAYEQHRRDSRVKPQADMAGHEPVEVPPDPVLAAAERSLVAKAFSRLPERWRAVLWHTEVEGSSVTEIATLLGLTPNGVSALAYRAREGLRQEYLQAHLTETQSTACRSAVPLLGRWTRGGLNRRETAQVEAHLDSCGRCRGMAAELTDLNTTLRAVVGPLVLGGVAASYLASTPPAAAITLAKTSWLHALGWHSAALVTAVVIGVVAVDTDAMLPAMAGPDTSVGAGLPPFAVRTLPPTSPATTTTAAAAPANSPGAVAIPPRPAAFAIKSTVDSVTLVRGGSPVDLPITLHNSGERASGVLSTTLALPPGVRYQGNGTCTQRDAALTCRSAKGLGPNESSMLTVPLVADKSATNGIITGSVSDGAASARLGEVRVDVTHVNPWSVRAGSIDVAQRIAKFWLTVSNSGDAAAEAAIEISGPPGAMFENLDFLHCTVIGPQMRCKATVAARGEFVTSVCVQSLVSALSSVQVRVVSGEDETRRSFPIGFQ
ncbi:sigma-70 family RNA polymerase sigma factor [Kutzneria albida]|uniref:Uncharacterized protein n=1 Tax=Kutzneria albida DSM 43870 TaxID=1449976 RepID=W5WFZ6_9PSEU|nr:sigma-70 family RNA polymerase sigma factor [Kutzneria albida]AHH99640.1 hypothetical protein KALB_6280 [Kutzneria albida DSM 43870]